jgi:hypothetical protein
MLSVKDFIVKTEDMTRNKKGKRVYLNDAQTRDLMKQLDEFFEYKILVPRIRVGKQQTIDTLIKEEALSFARYLRNEKERWLPRITVFTPKI